MTQQPLHGRTAIITGGSTEVAGTVALALAAEGVQVCLCGKQADVLELTARQIMNGGGTCLTITSDLDTLEAAEAVLEAARLKFSRVDLLILVSPFWAGGHIHEHSLRTWDLVLKANLREAFLMARAVLPLFREQKHGELMAIGSDSSLGIYPQDGAYGVAMHALTALMELIRVENAEFGIRTHILSPGVALSGETGADGQPALTAAHVAEWVIWLLRRPTHLRGNGNILV